MKVKAATLIESIVALSIISIAFGISLITFVSVLKSANLNRKVTAHEMIQSIAAETKINKIFIDADTLSQGIKYAKTIEHLNETGLIKLNIKAITQDSIVIENYSELIISDEKN